jgi:hypothetical protein
MPLEMMEGNYYNVGHRGPVYKGLGAMNPCDNLTGSFGAEESLSFLSGVEPQTLGPAFSNLVTIPRVPSYAICG